MKITELGEAEKVPFNLDGRIMLTNEKVELVHLTLKSGEILEKHTNPFDVAIFVLEGNGILVTDDKSINISANTCVEIEAGVNRGVENFFEGQMKLLVVKIFK